MYKYIVFLLSIAFTTFSFTGEDPTSAAHGVQAPLLPWTTDYEQALSTSKVQSLPIYLFFTGSTWCIWCKKIEAEIHEQDAFRQKVVGKFLFVKIDLPAGTQPTDQIKQLMKTYNIRGVPTVVIISPDGKELARFRYQKITPDEYADLVLNSRS